MIEDKKVGDLTGSELQVLMNNAQTTIIEGICKNMFETRDLDDTKKVRARMYYIDELMIDGKNIKSGFMHSVGSGIFGGCCAIIIGYFGGLFK